MGAKLTAGATGVSHEYDGELFCIFIHYSHEYSYGLSAVHIKYAAG
jgi:hypothetical protein